MTDLADKLEKGPAPREQVPCAQCGRLFTPVNRVHKYHDRQCRLDADAGRSAEESRRRAETGFAWPVVDRAPAVKVTVPKRKAPALGGKWATCVVLPDQQFGYRITLDGVASPFHDPRAIEIAEAICEAERPDDAVMLGDVNDLASFGKYRQEPSAVPATQRGIDRAAVHVAVVAALVRRLRILAGNHDIRIENLALDNALASAGLRRARRRPGEYPVLTMPYMLGLEDLPNVEWVGGWPAGATYINAGLAAIHGRTATKQFVEKLLAEERVSVVQGHVHRYALGMRTRNDKREPHFTTAWSPGCLCRIDGAVPSYKSGLDPWLEPPRSWEDWQQGLSVVRYERDGDRFAVEDVRIVEGEAVHRGQLFTSAKAVDDPEPELFGRIGQ